MIVERQDIEKIRASFQKMQTREDLLSLLNEAKHLLYGENTVAFELRQLTWYAFNKSSIRNYRKFSIKKKSGAKRQIHAPVKGLKQLQKSLSVVLQSVFIPHKAAFGFVWNKSIVDNAKTHQGSRYVYNIDLKDFFSSIDQARVWKCLQLAPFNLNTPETQKLANLIASLCCTEMEVERMDAEGMWVSEKKNVLAQGAPTSPVLSNVVCQRLDFLLSGVAKRFGLRYSRYADDITFSSMHNVYQMDGEFLKELSRIVLDQGFHIKDSKTRLQKEGYRQEVTGLLVNEKANVQKRYIKQLRMWLYYWEQYGYQKAENIFLLDYTNEKGHVKKGTPNMANVIKGKLDYLKMVKGNENAMFLKLKERFDLLMGGSDHLISIIKIWEEKGIHAAIGVYNKSLKHE
jgi:hypothetical protein